MIPRECKRLAEVDFPIAVVSKYAAREKNIHHAHPSTLHIWWARRPLAACRSMLLALLLPDPCDQHCPEDFKTKTREILSRVPGRPGNSDEELRAALLRFIGDFANWDHAASPTFLGTGRALIEAAYPAETQIVVDPFAGGGSIPLEALRLGCEAFASDLNPVACLILRTILEDIPRYGSGASSELLRVGRAIKAAAEKQLAGFYPKDPNDAVPIAYLWARTVRCEASNCGAEIPLARSLWLAKKSGRMHALTYEVVRHSDRTPEIQFSIFQPKSEAEVQRGLVVGSRATCPCCGTVLAGDRVRVQLTQQRGGADPTFDQNGLRTGGAKLLAVVLTRPGVERTAAPVAQPRGSGGVS
jgi:adenine-specific DNA methylase